MYNTYNILDNLKLQSSTYSNELHIIKLPNITNFIINNNLKFEKTTAQPLLQFGNYKQLNREKNNINRYAKIWYKYRSLTNKYELIQKTANRSVVNRAYYKLWEIYNQFPSINKLSTNSGIKIMGLAENPGGFMQATMDYRNNLDDEYYIMSLENETIKISDIISDKCNILTGTDDGGGDLLNPHNILHLKQTLRHSMDIITADGGMMVEDDLENSKEQLHLPLIFNEILSALILQSNSICGSFILKIYDIFTIPTVELLCLLSYYYNDVYIIKPLSSRCANSEKYIVCTGFNGINEDDLNKLIDISFQLYNQFGFIKQFFEINIPSNIIETIKTYNNKCINIQLKNITETLTIIAMCKNNIQMYNKIKNKKNKELYKYSKEWCLCNNISINSTMSF